MIREAAARWWSAPRTRRAVAAVLVVVGAALALVGVLTARWGWLIAGIIVVGLGAATGPARLRGR